VRFTHAARNQLGHLGAEIKNKDFLVLHGDERGRDSENEKAAR
jgi:hypothetical protein